MVQASCWSIALISEASIYTDLPVNKNCVARPKFDLTFGDLGLSLTLYLVF